MSIRKHFKPGRFLHASTAYICNRWISGVPFFFIRNFYYRWVMKFDFGRDSSMLMGIRFSQRGNLKIGSSSIVNWGCWLDNRGGIEIGECVSISPDVFIITADHDMNAADAAGRESPVLIEDYAFIGARATILPGVTVRRGAVVAAGSVVTKDVDEYEVVAGVPAKKIGERKQDLDYRPNYRPLFQ